MTTNKQYPMPVLTNEQQQQELIERCEEFIKQCGYATHAEAMTEADELDLLITQIALATLTAEPASREVIQASLYANRPLFTASSVPVLKPVDLYPIEFATLNDGYYLKRDDVIGAIHVAGYEVKE